MAPPIDRGSWLNHALQSAVRLHDCTAKQAVAWIEVSPGTPHPTDQRPPQTKPSNQVNQSINQAEGRDSLKLIKPIAVFRINSINSIRL
jgi:hypothetical protein